MPEHSRHRETWRVGAPVRVGAVTLAPIERVVIEAEAGALGLWCAAAREPYALVVRDAGGVRAVDAQAGPMSLEALREKVPELDRLLALL